MIGLMSLRAQVVGDAISNPRESARLVGFGLKTSEGLDYPASLLAMTN